MLPAASAHASKEVARQGQTGPLVLSKSVEKAAVQRAASVRLFTAALQYSFLL